MLETENLNNLLTGQKFHYLQSRIKNARKWTSAKISTWSMDEYLTDNEVESIWAVLQYQKYNVQYVHDELNF
jgi:hypothetical protein